MKNFTTIILEAVIVGVSMVFISLFIDKYFDVYLPKITKIAMVDGVFYTGILAHFIFEYSGVNIWYSKEYCKILKN